jgi:hypothetical protein
MGHAGKMSVTQLSVFLENKQTRLLEVCDLLGENGINIHALQVAETSEYAILRLIIDQPEAAFRLLCEGDVQAFRGEVLVVEVSGEPGGLANLLRQCVSDGLTIEYLYGFFETGPDRALVAVRFSSMADAEDILQRRGVRLARVEEIGAGTRSMA